ncbi:hypothetical protein OG618_37440 (plasmid) [Kitasatospora sp. NBC_01246]|uniref:hypothetical protein n=1 Tax=Kitasatospora sp. NBC_01246 TaxID=2903570 RepID=UPI002E371F07|nr:hypothetical protein [Kitasatospora sp. NBC_01246]
MLPTADQQARARTAYTAYGATTGNLNHLGKPMPAWDDLPPTIQQAWTAAAAAAAAYTRNPDPQFPASLAGGHALVLEYGDCEILASCQCGQRLGTSTPDRPLDDHATTWERHVINL